MKQLALQQKTEKGKGHHRQGKGTRISFLEKKAGLLNYVFNHAHLVPNGGTPIRKFQASHQKIRF